MALLGVVVVTFVVVTAAVDVDEEDADELVIVVLSTARMPKSVTACFVTAQTLSDQGIVASGLSLHWLEPLQQQIDSSAVPIGRKQPALMHTYDWLDIISPVHSRYTNEALYEY